MTLRVTIATLVGWLRGAGPDPHAQVQALVRRYLDPRARFGREQDVAMRGHLRECDACATYYGRSVHAFRLAVGADPAFQSGFERERSLAVLLDGSAAATESAPWRLPALSGALAAAAALVFVVSLPEPPTTTLAEADYVGVRGSGAVDARAAIGLSGVTEDGREYEVVAAETGAHLDDYLRVYTTVTDATLRFVFVVGLLGEAVEPLWYLPDPVDAQRESAPVTLGRHVPLGGPADGFELRLSGRHRPGPLAVVALFTSTPLTVDRVAEALRTRPMLVGLEDWLRSVLGMARTDVVHVASTTVRPGHMSSAGTPSREGPDAQR